MMHGVYGWHRFGWMGGIFMMVFWLLIIGLVVYLVSKSSNNRGHISSTESNRALEILNERYASGEIDEEEYLRKKKLLKK